jgi:hypothetical protein
MASRNTLGPLPKIIDSENVCRDLILLLKGSGGVDNVQNVSYSLSGKKGKKRE